MKPEFERRLLSRFPKCRPALPEAYHRIYSEHYVRNRTGGSPATAAARRLESWMHRKVAADVASLSPPYRTLEIGSGNLNHLEYEPSSTIYDVVEPFEELAATSPDRARISNAYRDIEEIHDTRYHRIISIAAFEHLTDLPAIVASCARLMLPDGQLRVAIPSEGTLLWGLGWRLTTGIEFRLRHRLDYGVLMRHEHVNTAREVAGILQIFFHNVRRQVLGISPTFSLYQFFECRSPRLDRCAAYRTLERTM